jgi:hypothetical protein
MSGTQMPDIFFVQILGIATSLFTGRSVDKAAYRYTCCGLNRVYVRMV